MHLTHAFQVHWINCYHHLCPHVSLPQGTCNQLAVSSNPYFHVQIHQVFGGDCVINIQSAHSISVIVRATLLGKTAHSNRLLYTQGWLFCENIIFVGHHLFAQIVFCVWILGQHHILIKVGCPLGVEQTLSHHFFGFGVQISIVWKG